MTCHVLPPRFASPRRRLRILSCRVRRATEAEMTTELTGSRSKELRDALVSAFPDFPKLTMLVSDELAKSLPEITAPGPMPEVVFTLITWAEAEGRIDDLVAG